MFISIYLIIANPAVQILVTRIASDFILRETGIKIYIGSLNYLPSTGIIIRNLQIEDVQHKNFITANRLNIVPSKFDFGKSLFEFNKVSLSGAEFNLIIYKGDSLSNLDRFLEKLSTFYSTKPKSDTSTTAFKLLSYKTQLRNVKFHMQNQNNNEIVEGMNYSDINVDVKELLIRQLNADQNSITCDIKKLSAFEKSGFELHEFNGQITFSSKLAKFLEAYAHFGDSKLKFNLEFGVNNWSDLNDFINKVKMHAVFDNSIITISDLKYFSKTLENMNNTLSFSGKIDGTIRDLYGTNLDIRYLANTIYKGDASLKGLPDIDLTYMVFRFDEIITKKSELSEFHLPNGEGIPLPIEMDKLGTIRGKGDFKGFLNDFELMGEFTTLLGRISTNIQICDVLNPDLFSYLGMINTTGFNLGKLLEKDDLVGNVSFTINAKGSGYSIKNMKVDADGIINELYINKYNLKNIRVNGIFDHMEFIGNLNINDENLNLDFNGSADFSFNYPVFDFKSKISNINLNRLNILNTDSIIRFATNLTIRLKGNNPDNLLGGVYIDSTKLFYGDSRFFMKYCSIVAFNDTGNFREIRVNSDFADINVTGDYKFAQLSKSLLDFLNSYTSSSIPVRPTSDSITSDQLIEFTVNIKNTEEIARLLLPSFRISKNSILKGKYNSKSNFLSIDGEANKITYSGIDIYSWKFKGFNTDKALKIENKFQRVFFTGSSKHDSTAIGIDSVFLSAGFRNDTLGFKLDWNDIRYEGTNRGDINGKVSFAEWPRIGILFNNSAVTINDRKWDAPHINNVIIDTTALIFNDFLFSSENSELKLSGRLSNNLTDTLNITISKFAIELFNPLLEAYKTEIIGELSGNATIVGGLNSPRLYSDVFIDDFYFNGYEVGDVDAMVNWDNEKEAANTDLKIIYTGNSGSSPVIAVEGSYYPYKKIQNFDFRIDLENLNLRLLNPFLEEVVSQIEGTATGHFDLKGSNKKPDLTGNLKLMRTGFMINYLNTKYSLADKIEIKKNLIEFENIVINDTAFNKAILSGKITHENLSDFYFDLKIDARQFSALNTNETLNSMFYGKAATTGIITITGPIDDLGFNIDVASNSGTHVVVPLNMSTEVSSNSFIVFVNTPDTNTVTTQPVKYSANLKGLSLNMDLKITPDAQVELHLPANLGDIKAKGNSDMKMNVNTRGDFSMVGDYIIQEGSFNFTFQKLVSKLFVIEKGSKISFTGNPLDADVDLVAVYRSKPPLIGLPLATDTANLSKRVNADCILTLTEKLMNPVILFNIRFPGLDEDIKQLIYATLDTNDQSVMSQQVISLLVLNSFNYSSTNGGTLAYSTLQMLSNQIGNVLSKLSDDFEIGINYNPGIATASEELEVDLHGQLFDSRLVIDGNFGVKNNRSGGASNTSNIVGDVNVEYKVTSDGRFRVRAFNRTNDLNLIEKNSQYTQGVGFLFRKDFENFKDMFIKKPKNKKQNKRKSLDGAILNNEEIIHPPNYNLH